MSGFEVYNTSATELYVGGLVVSDLGSDSFTVTSGAIIPALSYFVFGQSDDAVRAGRIIALE